MAQAGDRLRRGGRVLLFFGTSGDMAHLRDLIDRHGFVGTTVAQRELTRDVTVCYEAMRLQRPATR